MMSVVVYPCRQTRSTESCIKSDDLAMFSPWSCTGYKAQKGCEGYKVVDGHFLIHQHNQLNGIDPRRFDGLCEQGRGRCIYFREDTDPAILPKKPY